MKDILVMFTLVLLAVFAFCVGFCYAEGMWSNAIRLICLVLAGVMAVNYFEPTAKSLEALAPSYTFAMDFLAFWLVFVMAFVLLQGASNVLSRVRVRFLKIADRIGSGVFSVLIGWIMVCIVTTSMHLAPFGREPLGGSFRVESSAKGGLAPDYLWLGFVQKLSRGAYCRSASEQEWKQEKYVFDPKGEFMLKYATRRSKLEAHMARPETRSIRIDPTKS